MSIVAPLAERTMNRKPPAPVCKPLVICRKIVQTSTELTLVGIVGRVSARFYPTGRQLGIYARWASVHGDYLVETQLQTMEGTVVWREGAQAALPMHDPLKEFNVVLNMTVVFPEPGMYDVVLLANGEEIARQKLAAVLETQKAEPQEK